MKKLNYVLLLLSSVAFMAISCQKEQSVAPEADNVEFSIAKYTSLFGTFNHSSEQTSSPNIQPNSSANGSYEYYSFSSAMASNGDVIDIIGENTFDMIGSNEGTLSVHPKSAKGGGTFTHKAPNGTILGAGTWTATELLSFQDYGSSPFLSAFGPPFDIYRAGVANIRVHMMVANGGPTFSAILRIQCLLPEVKTPPSWVEGIRISIQDGLNFNKSVEGGATLFIIL